MMLFLASYLMDIGLMLIAAGIPFAILFKNNKWHIMTGIAAGMIIFAFIIFSVIVIPLTSQLCENFLNPNNYASGYEQSESWEDIQNDDDYFIGDFIEHYIEQVM